MRTGRLLLTLTLLAGLGACADQGTGREESPRSAVSTSPAPDPDPSASTRPTQVEAGRVIEPAAPAVRPTSLRLEDMRAPVVPIDLDGGVLTPPDDPTVLGWWGRPVGAPRGVTLLVGHTVSTGGGTFDDLEDVPAGARLRVSGRTYTVGSNRVISKARLARRAPQLFDQSGPHRVVLVTCEDYDPETRTYASNVVVVARPR